LQRVFVNGPATENTEFAEAVRRKELAMGFLDSLKKAFAGKPANKGKQSGGGSSFGDDGGRAYWVYAQCRRCGEPLRARVDLHNEPSEEEGGTWFVRKGLTGSGKYYCFQTVEVTLHFDRNKRNVLESEAVGGTLITAEEYPTLLAQWQEDQARQAEEQRTEE
jgi:hypothetical protein